MATALQSEGGPSFDALILAREVGGRGEIRVWQMVVRPFNNPLHRMGGHWERKFQNTALLTSRWDPDGTISG
jgi:hypothetical protein